MAARSGTTGTGSRVPRPGSQCSTRSEGTQSLWKHNQFLERRGEKRKSGRCDSCCTLCSPGAGAIPTDCWLVSCPTLLLMETQLNHTPNLTLTQLFQILLEESKGIRLCLFAAPSHFLSTYLGNLILATLSPKPTLLAAAQLDSTCTTQLSTGWAESMWEIKKGHSLNELKRNQCESSCSVSISLVQRKDGICWSYGYLDQPLLTVMKHSQNKNTSLKNLELSLIRTYEALFNITLVDIPASYFTV